MKPIRTVADLIDALQVLDPTLPLGCLTYGEQSSVRGPLMIVADQYRKACDETLATFCGQPHWFALDTPQALWQEQRGAGLETIAVVMPGP